MPCERSTEIAAISESFRRYRAALIRQSEKPNFYSGSDESRWQVQRAIVSRLRGSAAYAIESSWSKGVAAEHGAKQVLRIPSQLMSFRPGFWKVLAQYLIGAFIPYRFNLAVAKRRLSEVATFEGREFLYQHFVRRVLAGERYYSPSLDVVLCRFHLTSGDEVARLERFKFDALRAFVRLGFVRESQIPAGWSCSVGNRASTLLWIFANRSVIRSVEEIQWMDVANSDSRADDALDHEGRQAAFSVVQQLTEAGVSRESLVRTLSGRSVQFRDTKNLASAVKELTQLGINVEEALTTVGDQLWRTDPTRWKFMAHTMGVNVPKDLARFSETLGSYAEPAPDFVQALREAGATTDDLLCCERLLLGSAGKSTSSHRVTAVRLLTSAPLSIAVSELPEFDTYFKEDRDLPSFLQALASAGYGTREAVRAFQPCYASAAHQNLTSLLALAAPCSAGSTLADVVDWVDVAVRSGYLAEIQRLTRLVKIASIPELHTATKLAPLGLAFITWLIEVKKLTSIKALKTWHRDAVGIIGLRLWGTLKDVDRVLLEDAWNRNNYSLYESNRKALSAAAQAIARAQLGRFPFDAEKAAQELYHQRWRSVEEVALSDFAPVLPSILKRTGGVLVASILEAARFGEEQLDSLLKNFQPLLLELTAGRGPTTDSLTMPQLEAIALVYRTDIETVGRHWSEVLGYESSAPLSFEGPFTMRWKASRHESTAAFDRSGLDALRMAREFATNFEAEYKRKMGDACRYLRARSLTPAAEPKDIANHLGLLLALVGESGAVSEWTHDEIRKVAGLRDGDPAIYPALLRLERLFCEDLPEGLNAHAAAYVRQLTAVDADMLATRLGFNDADVTGLTGQALLNAAIDETRKLVLPLLVRWGKAEKKKFTVTSADTAALTLETVVTKYPAAFFARMGASLCTSTNFEMWKESRHAHLVAFDPVAQRMAGMAYLYVEHVPALGPAPVLVIRAINPSEDLLAEYSPESIVSEFFRVATAIAQLHELSHVCFCAPGGMHLMSNRSRIEEDVIREKYIKASRPGRLIDGLLEPAPRAESPVEIQAKFSAYEIGSEVVHKLYVIWDAATSTTVATGESSVEPTFAEELG